jgi:hypothetical protein
MERFDDTERDIFVSGLDSDQELYHLASRYGVVLNVRILRDQEGVSKGMGFARYHLAADAIKGVAGLDGLHIRRRILHCRPVTVQPRPGHPVSIPAYQGRGDKPASPKE